MHQTGWFSICLSFHYVAKLFYVSQNLATWAYETMHVSHISLPSSECRLHIHHSVHLSTCPAIQNNIHSRIKIHLCPEKNWWLSRTLLGIYHWDNPKIVSSFSDLYRLFMVTVGLNLFIYFEFLPSLHRYFIGKSLTAFFLFLWLLPYFQGWWTLHVCKVFLDLLTDFDQTWWIYNQDELLCWFQGQHADILKMKMFDWLMVEVSHYIVAFHAFVCACLVFHIMSN